MSSQSRKLPVAFISTRRGIFLKCDMRARETPAFGRKNGGGTIAATLIRMSEPQWSVIPTKLKAKGFSVFYDRVSYAPEHPLWCAKANRNGRQWSTFGKNLPTALIELERQTKEAA